jgi:NAD(P)-dependent dehydrogenase (short-subunit alcohol dehydrogenase family)
MPVGLLARSSASIDGARAALADDGATQVAGVLADATDEAGLRAALDALVEELGVPKVVVYNAAVVRLDRLGELSHEERKARYAVNVLGVLTTVAHLAPRMVAAGGGTIIATGGMPEPEPELVSLSIDKAALRAAIVLLARQFEGDGIHVSTVTVGGPVAPGTRFDPEQIADAFWWLHMQPPGMWEREIVYNGVAESR